MKTQSIIALSLVSIFLFSCDKSEIHTKKTFDHFYNDNSDRSEHATTNYNKFNINASVALVNHCFGLESFAKNIALIHNEAELYIINHPITPNNDLSIRLRLYAERTTEFLVNEKKFNPASVAAAKKIILPFALSFKNISHDSTRLDSAAFRKKMIEVQKLLKFSNNLLNNISQLYGLGGTDIDRVLSFVNTNFDCRKWAGIDAICASVIINITNESLIFWSQQYGGTVRYGGLKCSTWVIINDGIGGVIGLLFDGIGSIVTATILSAATNEDCPGN